jgi:hypothetical protein
MSRKCSSIHPPPHFQREKLRSFLCYMRDDVGLKESSVYGIPCECWNVYIGETGRSNETIVTSDCGEAGRAETQQHWPGSSVCCSTSHSLPLFKISRRRDRREAFLTELSGGKAKDSHPHRLDPTHLSPVDPKPDYAPNRSPVSTAYRGRRGSHYHTIFRR